MTVQWSTFSEEGDRAMSMVMRDLLSQAKMGDWTPSTDWDTLANIFMKFAATHPSRPSDDSGWDDTDTMEIVVWVMRSHAQGKRVELAV